MAPTYYADRRYDLAMLVEHCGFSPDEPLLLAEPEFSEFDHVVDLTFKSIRGQSNEAVSFKIDDEINASPWHLSFVPEGIRALGSGAGTSLRGGPWHSSDPDLLLMGWGHLHNIRTNEFISGECLIVTPNYYPGEEPEDSRECFCQLRPTGVALTSAAAEYYASLREQS